MTNPFQLSSTELVHLSTGLTAPSEVSADLLSVQQKGGEAFKEFQQQPTTNRCRFLRWNEETKTKNVWISEGEKFQEQRQGEGFKSRQKSVW